MSWRGADHSRGPSELRAQVDVLDHAVYDAVADTPDAAPRSAKT